MKATDAAAVVSLFDEKASGQEVEDFQVFGINSLKTLVPPTALVGLRVGASEVQAGKIEIDLGTHVLEVDLQRKGAAVWYGPDTPADREPRATTVTGRIAFTDGTKISFVEPDKTKRIAFWISARKQS